MVCCYDNYIYGEAGCIVFCGVPLYSLFPEAYDLHLNLASPLQGMMSWVGQQMLPGISLRPLQSSLALAVRGLQGDLAHLWPLSQAYGCVEGHMCPLGEYLGSYCSSSNSYLISIPTIHILPASVLMARDYIGSRSLGTGRCPITRQKCPIA